MKTSRVLSVAAFVSVMTFLFVHAQQFSKPVQGGAIEATIEAPLLTGSDLSRLSADDMGLLLVLLEKIPAVPADEFPKASSSGGFFSLQNPQWPPFPANINGLDVWPLDQSSYLLDDRVFSYSGEKGSKSGALGGMHLLDGPPSGFSTSYTAPTNGWLWLSIETVTNGEAAVTLHETTNEIYELISKVALPDSTWHTEQSLHGTTNANTIATTVPVLDRTNHLFLWARVWTTNDVDADSLPDWWEWENFGNFSQSGTNDYDGDGVDNATEYESGTDPNKIRFTIQLTNNYVNAGSVSPHLAVSNGVPSGMAILVDSTNFTGATWSTYNANPSIYLGSAEGWHEIWIGLRGRQPTSQQTWQWKRIKLDPAAPRLVITSPTNSIVTQPVIQLIGYSPEVLASLRYDLTNSAGHITNHIGLVTDSIYSTNTWEFTTNFFQCFDVPLTTGTNRITLRATDLAGNMTTTNLIFILDYSSKTNAPTVQLSWPQGGERISGNNFTWRGHVNDPTATVTATIVNGGVTNAFSALMERNGNFWLDDLPLDGGTNSLMLTITDSAGNTTFTNATLVKDPMVISITPPNPDDLWNDTITVNGSIGTNTWLIWVNGIQGTNNNGSFTVPNVPLDESGEATFQVIAYPPGHNPSSPGGAVAMEYNQDKPVRVYVQRYAWTGKKQWWQTVTNYDGTISPETAFAFQVKKDWIDGVGGASLVDIPRSYHYATGDIINEDDLLQLSDAASRWPASGAWTSTLHGKQWGVSEWTPFTNSVSYTNENGFGDLLNIYCEHCDVQGNYPPWSESWTGLIGGWSLDPAYGPSGASYQRHAQTILKLHTGGRALMGSESLIEISARAAEILDKWVLPPFSGSGTRDVPPEQIYIGNLGHLGSDGKLYIMLPDGDPSVEVKVDGLDYYTFTVSAIKYTMKINANGTPLKRSTSAGSALFCVGQNIDFTQDFDPSLPAGTTKSKIKWAFGGNFVNESNQPCSTCSVNYTNNAALLTNETTHAWWTSGGYNPSAEYQASVGETLTFTNGQKVDVSPIGIFNMHRPQIYYYTSGAKPDATISAGQLVTSPPGKFQVSIHSAFGGLAGVTQLANGYETNADGIMTTTNTHQLDNREFVRNFPSISDLLPVLAGAEGSDTNNHAGRADAPTLDCSGTTELHADFKVYIRFQPSGDNSIFVTLGRVNWHIYAIAIPYLTGFALNGLPDGDIDSNYTPSEEFPFWKYVLTNQGE